MKTARVYEIDGVVPVIAPGSFVHPDAVIIGDVIIAPNCYIGPCACLRGDMGTIRLAEGVSVQDNCVIHSFPDCETVVDARGLIGHGAILHGCRVGRNALVGMQAVVMDGAEVGDHAIVAAMSLVEAGMQIPAGVLAIGIPARITRTLSQDERIWMGRGAEEYRRLTDRSIASLKPAVPLERPEENRPRLPSGRIKIRPLHGYKKR